jgi:pimeloyl-ACP methyl ester carboxylesterase
VRRFHRDAFIDYQLNRLYGEGHARLRDLTAAAARIRSAGDCARVLADLADCAEGEGRLANAAFYVRGAEFFTQPGAPEKRPTYERFLSLFGRAFADEGIERHAVPYRGAALPASRLAARGARRGTVLLFGGFDSLIEEFVAAWRVLAEAGLDVIAFDGPGQGGARALHGLTFEHDWERPVGAVLDHFGLEGASLVGMSMGGYWALRAAAFEPRIARVVAWPPVYDWLEPVPPVFRPVVRAFVRRRGLLRGSIRLRMRLFPLVRHVVAQTLYISGASDPAAVGDWFLRMNRDHLCSERVTQDVLLLVGEADAFQPPVLARAQARALTNARSVTTRVFTRAEQGHTHCQMGNLSLAASVAAVWLESGKIRGKSGEATR